MVSIQKAMDSATFSHFVLALSHLFFRVFSQRKSRTWRNSLRSWGESNNISQRPKKSSLKTTRRAMLLSSSWELQSTSLPLKLTTKRRLRRSWTPFLPVSILSRFDNYSIIDLKKEQLKWGSHLAKRLAIWAVKEQQYAHWANALLRRNAKSLSFNHNLKTLIIVTCIDGLRSLLTERAQEPRSPQRRVF